MLVQFRAFNTFNKTKLSMVSIEESFDECYARKFQTFLKLSQKSTDRGKNLQTSTLKRDDSLPYISNGL